MNMIANAGPYGGPFGQSAGQGLPGAGLSPQLQNKAGMANNMASQFNMEKKVPTGQGMPGMVRMILFFKNWLIYPRHHSTAVMRS